MPGSLFALYESILRAPASESTMNLSSISLTVQARAVAALFGLVTTGVIKWGISLKADNSTRFGSIRIILTSSGCARARIETSKLLIQTLFPEPVAPAMRRWGISPRSSNTGWPLISLPNPSTSRLFFCRPSGEARISPKVTSSLYLFGTSMPTADFPGIGARIRTSGEASASAMSSDRPIIRPTLTPVASWISYLVTWGPCTTLPMVASTSKLCSVRSRILMFSLMFFREWASRFDVLRSKSKGGAE